MGVFYESPLRRQPTQGICYGCRHPEDQRYSTTGHCRGTGDLEGDTLWPGFICTCECRGDEWKLVTSATK